MSALSLALIFVISACFSASFLVSSSALFTPNIIVWYRTQTSRPRTREAVLCFVRCYQVKQPATGQPAVRIQLLPDYN